MKIRALALNTWLGLIHNRLIVLFLAIFLGLLLLLLAPLSSMRHNQAGAGALTFIEILISILSAFGSLLVIWASADAIGAEIQSGTVLAVLARPLHRWEFLVGKFLGVQLLMACYIAFMAAFTCAAATLGGVKIQTPWWELIAYPLTRYALYGALAMLFATRLRPIFALACVIAVMITATMVSGGTSAILPVWLCKSLYAVMPSTGLLAESRFFNLTQGATRVLQWREHLTILAYGLDYVVLCLLAASALFRRRSLNRT